MIFQFEKKYYREGYELIGGTDEAGRGPLAGPVVAAAVVFRPDTRIEGINDSKKLTESKREKLFDLIELNALSVGVSVIDNYKIDDINILQASLLAMKESVSRLDPQPGIILIDGNKTFTSDIPVEAIIKGDSLSFSIAAASIIAKVTRDRIMVKLSEEYPVYNWKQNKGYPTKEHREAVLKFGLSPYHRKSFCGKILESEKQTVLF